MTTPVYSDIGTLKDRLGIDDTNDDITLTSVLAGVSRELDRYCGRFFYQAGTVLAPQVRYYTPQAADMLDIDDLVSISDLSTDITSSRDYTWVWGPTDYDLEPYNAALMPEPEPYTSIHITPRTNRNFWPGMQKSARVTGIFGWPAIPDVVREAILLLGARLYKRKDAVFGVMGSAEMGMFRIPRGSLDPDFQELIPDALRRTANRATVSWHMAERNYRAGY